MPALAHLACLISLGLVARTTAPQGKASYLVAKEWAQGPAQTWSDQHLLKMPPAGNAFLVSSSEALAPNAWYTILINETRVEFADTYFLPPDEQLALLHLAAPKAGAADLLAAIIYAHDDFMLSRINRYAGGVGCTVQGPTGAPVDPEIDAFLGTISNVPIPFFPKLVRDPVMDGSNIHFEDRWGRDPVFTFDTHGLVEDPSLRSRWGQPEVIANKLITHLEDLWALKLKADQYRTILAQLRDIHIQGPAWFGVAAAKQWPGLAWKLLDRGLDPRIPGPEGTVPLIAACSLKDEALFEFMIQKWGSPMACIHRNERVLDSPLLAAVLSGLPSRVERMLSLGANPNASSAGILPLEFAIELDSLPVVQTLLKAGAKATSRDMDLAREAGSKEVLDAIQKARAATP